MTCTDGLHAALREAIESFRPIFDEREGLRGLQITVKLVEETGAVRALLVAPEWAVDVQERSGALLFDTNKV